MNAITRLLAGFRLFRTKYYERGEKNVYGTLISGQQPKVLVIACSDSRVDPAILLHTEPGELFVVRNVANLVPPHQPDEHYHGTSTAIEFAVRDLNVQHIIVIGHSDCGGIQALRRARAGQLDDREYMNKWMSIAEGGCPLHDHVGNEFSATQTEHAAIVRSVDNLRTFPWVRSREGAGDLQLHGWWFDMNKGALWAYEPSLGIFQHVKS